MSGGAARSSSRIGVLSLALVALAAMLVFLPSLDGQWLNWDDETNFVYNPHFRGLGLAHLRWMFTATVLAVYAPLSWVTLGANYVAGGMDPWGYHLVNLLIHGASAALFFLVARRLLAAGLGARLDDGAVTAGAVAAGLVFAVHPLRAESVGWVTERRDVLSAMLYLAAALAYLRGVGPDGRLAARWRNLSLAAFAAALLSKGLAMTLPLSLLVVDVYPLRRRVGWRALLTEKVPYAALATLGALAAVWAVSREVHWTSYGERGPAERLAMTAYSIWFYPAKLVWPVDLSPYYEIPERVSLAEWRFLGPLLGVVLVSVALLALRRRCPGALAAWIHSAIVLGPVSGIVHAGAQLAHDRYSYVSGLGFAALAGAGVAWILLARRRGQVGGATAAVAVAGAAAGIVLLGAGGWEQAKVWRHSEALWRAAAAADPTCGRCESNLGNVLYGQQHFREAEIHYRRAIEIRPRLPEPYNNLGIALAAQRRYPEAEAAFREALAREPRLAGGIANLGLLYAEQGRWAEATPLLQKALVTSPDIPGLRDAAGHAFAERALELDREGKPAEAAALRASARQTAARPAAR